MEKILFLVDCQYDFFEGGLLPVPASLEIIPVINDLIKNGGYDSFIVSQDWHPKDHTSFAVNHNVDPFSIVDDEMKWPVHCIKNTKGSEIHNDIIIPIERSLDVDGIRKGDEADIEQYSAIDNMYPDHIDGAQIDVVGLAIDYCVKATAIDLINKTGVSEVNVLLDGCRGVDPKTTLLAIDEMRKNGINVIKT